MKKRGFTLIELLVVIAIIGMLSSVVLASLQSARGKARDARRKEDLNQIYTALALYYDDKGYLPTTDYYSGADAGGWDFSSQGSFVPFLSGYISDVKDPINNGTGNIFSTGSGYAYAYYCYASENSLALGTKLENGTFYFKANHELGWKCKTAIVGPLSLSK
jgi:prepilin-type N-terminal cleavage/methylation domain-containing protein